MAEFQRNPGWYYALRLRWFLEEPGKSGNAACGEAELANENYEQWLPLPDRWDASVLPVQGRQSATTPPAFRNVQRTSPNQVYRSLGRESQNCWVDVFDLERVQGDLLAEIAPREDDDVSTDT
jgi:hypothetical protein